MKKKPTLNISIKDPNASAIVELLGKNKDHLDYEFGSRGIIINSLSEEGNEIVVQIMDMAEDYSLE